MPTSSSGKATLSATVRQGKVDSSWNTMPIDLCGPEMVSPATVTTPSCWPSRPPMTLNSVDFPQPEGPITERNSPGRTLSETLSTAVIGPSGVSKRTTIWSATRIGSPDAAAAAIRLYSLLRVIAAVVAAVYPGSTQTSTTATAPASTAAMALAKVGP